MQSASRALALCTLFATASIAMAQRPALRPGQSNWAPPPPNLQGGILTSDMTSNSAQALVNLFAGPGVVTSNASFTGALSAGGRFSGGLTAFGFDGGVVLSTGDVATIVGPQNRYDNATTFQGTPGDPTISAGTGQFTHDAASLEFVLTCTTPQTISFQLVFASDEYNEGTVPAYKDTFMCLVNGANVAFVPGTSSQISIGELHCGATYSSPGGGPNCSYLINNDCDDLGLTFPCVNLPTEMDGVTTVMTVVAPVMAGPNTIRLVVADAVDPIVDSVVLLRAGSLICGSPTPEFLTPSPCGQILSVRANDALIFNVAAAATNGLASQVASLALVPPTNALAGATFMPPLGTLAQPATSQVTWTPTTADIGLRTVRFRATDQLGLTSECEFQVLVEPDPPFVPCEQRLVSSSTSSLDRQGDQVGYSDGRAIVGASQRLLDGAVAIYEELAGVWSQVADIPHPFATGGQDAFGWAVAISGDWAVVGAPFEGTPGMFNGPGAAYVFRRGPAGTWTFAQELQRSGVISQDDRFGLAVDINGNELLVGAFGDNTSAPNAGAVYVYRLFANTWVLEQKLVASVVQPTIRFGVGVAIEAGRAVIGAPYEDHSGRTEIGATYVFERQPNSTWLQTARLTGPTAASNSFYGVSVDLSGTRAIVGAEGIGGVGQAYIYRRDAVSTWTLEGVLDPQVPAPSLTYGQQVGLRGGIAAVNGRNATVQGLPVAGAVELFELGTTSNWVYTRTLTKATPVAFDSFGTGLALGIGVAMVGCPGDDSSGFTNGGASYLFDLGIADCNNNGNADSCDLASGSSQDCNANLVPDECDLLAGALDCNTNGVLDSCEIAGGTTPDCNGNGVPDSCDIAGGASADCNGNLVPDSCEVVTNPSLDCNGDGIIDTCQFGTLDCNSNQLLDPCETAQNPAIDVNHNSIPDECEDDTGTIYCSPNAPNSGFPGGGKMQAIGTPSVNTNDIVLIARDLPSHSFGFFIASRNAGFVPFPGGSQGILCLGGTIGRFQQQVQNTGTLNRISIPLDNRNIPFPSGPGFATVVPGERWHFQAWFRDSVSGVSTSSFTEGMYIQY